MKSSLQCSSVISLLLVLGCGSFLINSCGGGSQTSVTPPSQPDGSTQSGVVTLSQRLDPLYAGELRFDISNVQGSLPESFSLQGATFLLLDTGNAQFYAADLGSLLKPLDPFSQILLPGVQSAQVKVIELPIEAESSPGTAPVYQNNPRLVTLQDVALVLALQQLGGSPTAAQLATQASTLLGTPVSAGSLNPVPSITNSDYANPAGSMTLSDVAVIQAGYYLFPADRKVGTLAAVATRLLKASPQLSNSDIRRIPGVFDVPPATPGLALSPAVGSYRAANLAFSVLGALPTDRFSLGTTPTLATFAKLQLPAFPGYTTFVAEQGSAFVQLPAFRNVAIPGIGEGQCVIVHEPKRDPSEVQNWISRTNGCQDPRALDIVVGNFSGSSISMLAGKGNGTFNAFVTAPSGDFPVSLVAAEINNDGQMDLVTASLTATASSVSVLLGSGQGLFQPPVTYATGNGSSSLETGDLNGDGRLDLAVTNGSSGTISVLLGNGNGTFQPQVTFTTGSGSGSVRIGDLNGDGRMDLAAPNNNLGTISVLLGNGNGTFQPQVTVTTGSGPQSLSLGDMNGDGNLDLTTANTGASTVSVLLGNGNGTFKPQVTFATGTAPRTLASGDLNGDGRLDLATANDGSNTVSVLLGNGNGTFQPQVSYSAGTAPYAVVLGDVNGDSKPDLVTTNPGLNRVLVMLGNGDGTVQSPVTYATGLTPFSAVLSSL